MRVAIYQLDRGTSLWMWLCPRHVLERVCAGFDVKERKEAKHELTCDDRRKGKCGEDARR